MNTLISAFITTVCILRHLIKYSLGQLTLFEFINIYMNIHEYTHECIHRNDM